MAQTSYDVPAVRKAIRLIELLCESEHPLGVSEIGHRLDLNKNMVFRLLRTLQEEGWIIQENGGAPKYRMSLRPFHHASKPVSRTNLRVAANEPIRELWQDTGESTYLGVLDGDRTLFLEHLDATGNIRLSAQVGGRYAMHCAAPGKVLLAHADEALLKKLAKKGFERQTRRTICDLPALQKALDEVIRQGYALDLEEYADGLLCFAAPIHDYKERVIGTVGQSVLTLHYTPERLVEELGPNICDTARKISLAMGYCSKKRNA